MKLKDLSIYKELSEEFEQTFIDNPIDTKHIQIDPSTKVGLLLDGDIIMSDKFSTIVQFLKTTDQPGTYSVTKDGLILLTVTI